MAQALAPKANNSWQGWSCAGMNLAVKRLIHSIFCLVCLIASIGAGKKYDVVIRHGRVVDGAGNAAFFGDVAIQGDRIAAIGKIAGEGEKEIDATGLIVAPGFIDVHTHADSLASRPAAENFVRMGVTTVVAGNCGGSALDIANSLRTIEQTKAAVNYATLIGHNTVRSKAMGGTFNRPPSSAEMQTMKSLVEKAMKDGAFGLSTGLIYLPGTFAQTEEIIELAKVASAYDGIYASHMRNEGAGIFGALDELFRIAREARIRAEISHIKLAGERAWGQADKLLAAIEKARADGLDITQDQYSYTASSTGLRQTIPEEAFEGGRAKFLERLNNPTEKAKIVSSLKQKLHNRGRDDYAYAVIALCKHDPSLTGLNVVEATRKIRVDDSLDAQIETILEIEKNGGASAVFHGMSEEDVQTIMRHPNTMVASDSGLLKFGEGIPHPRGYGNNARILGRYVRELKVLRLEEAIRKMTSLPATTFRLKGRGQLREDNWGDIVVFDPAKVQDNATFKDPHHYPTGIIHVFVNGKPVLENGELTNMRPGRVLRHK